MFVATGLCLAGFLRPPRSRFELLLPRFVVPFIFWTATAYQAISFAYFPLRGHDSFAQYRVDFGAAAMSYIALCICCFFIGFYTPLFSGWSRRFAATGATVALNEPSLRQWSIILGLLSFVPFILLAGRAALSNGSGIRSQALATSALLVYLVGKGGGIFGVLSAILFGLGWPTEKNRLRLLPMAGIVLFLDSFQNMAWFSRGSGIFFPAMVAGYVFKTRRIPYKTAALAFLWAIICANTGLSGRGIYGHGGGFFPYWTHWWYCLFNWSHAFTAFAGALDAFTPVTVVMAGLHAGNQMGAMSPENWWLYQVPVPHVFFFHMRYTFTTTYFLGGRGAWNYTPSMFGDTFAHLGWSGCSAFIPVGAAYGLVERILMTSDDQGQGRLNLMTVLLPICYLAAYIGCFNDYRSWVSSFMFPTVGIIVLIRVFARLRGDDDPPDLNLPDEAYHANLSATDSRYTQ